MSSSSIEPPSKRQKLEGILLTVAQTVSETATMPTSSSTQPTASSSSSIAIAPLITPQSRPSPPVIRNAFSFMAAAQQKLTQEEKKTKLAAAFPPTQEELLAKAERERVRAEMRRQQEETEKKQEESRRLWEEEQIEEKKRRKQEVEVLRAKNALIQNVYSDDAKSSTYQHLISIDIGMPNVLADLILEYTHHPVLTLWEAIEAECQSHDPNRIENGQEPFLEVYSRGWYDTDDQFADLDVPPERIKQLESDLCVKLNDPSFSLPDDLKILWSIRDGFEPIEWSRHDEFESTDQHLLNAILFPTIEMVEHNTSSQMSSLHASYCVFDFDGARDRNINIMKYHLQSGVISHFRLKNAEDFVDQHLAPWIRNSPVRRQESAREYLTKSPPLVIFHSLRHYLECLLKELKDDPPAAESEWDEPAFRSFDICPVGTIIDSDEEAENEVNLNPGAAPSSSSATHVVAAVAAATAHVTQPRGHLTSAELISITDELTWQHELPILCELLASPHAYQNELHSVHTYYNAIVDTHQYSKTKIALRRFG